MNSPANTSDDIFVSELVDMDLSKLYNLSYLVKIDSLKFNFEPMFGPMAFEDVLSLILDIDREILNTTTGEISIQVVNKLNRDIEFLSGNTVQYLIDKADSILAEYMLIGHRETEYDCEAEIITGDYKKLFKQ